MSSARSGQEDVQRAERGLNGELATNRSGRSFVVCACLLAMVAFFLYIHFSVTVLVVESEILRLERLRKMALSVP